MKTMLFVNGSYNEIPLIKAARKFGYYVITSGNDSHGEGHKYANRYCPCDYSDKEAIYELARNEHVDAICSCGNDFGAISAAYACERLGLPGHDSFENAKRFHEKDCFKALVNELNLPSPKSSSFFSVEEADDFIRHINFPIIVKPTDLGGGKGISVARSVEEGKVAIEDAFKASKVKKIVIEEYIDGTQHGYVCFLKNKKVVFSNITDDLSYLNPYMVWISCRQENIDTDIQQKITADVNRIANYCDLADGFFCIQYMVRDNQIFYLETMRRCLGNLHYDAMSKDFSINFYELFVANEAGLDTQHILDTLYDNRTFSGFMGLYSKANGRIDSINIDPWFYHHVYDSLMLEGIGYTVTDYMHDKIGMVMYSFDNKENRNYFLNNCRNMFEINVQR